MNTFKKICLLMSLLLLAAPILTACSPTSGPEGPTDDNDTEEPTTGGNGDPTTPGVTKLRTISLKNPIGIDSTPLFSWQMISDSSVRGQVQTAYRIVVSDSSEKLAAGDYNMWDSGKIASSQTANITYGGKATAPSTRYYWKVFSWDSEDKMLSSDETAYFETGLLDDNFSGAEWITQPLDFHPDAVNTNKLSWIWLTKGAAQGQVAATTQYFRAKFQVDPSKKVSGAWVALSADDYGTAYINGNTVATIPDEENAWTKGNVVDITDLIVSGENIVAAAIVNKGVGYAGLLCRVTVKYTDGSMSSCLSGPNWLASDKKQDGFEKLSFDDSGWVRPTQNIAYGSAPWSSNVTFEMRDKSEDETTTSAPMLRKTFTVPEGKEIASARIYATAAGIYDLYCNGERVGDAYLAPGSSQYNERLLYQTYDITESLSAGENVIGAVLGRGWYLGIFKNYGNNPPAFLCKTVIKYTDGTEDTIVSDGSWQSYKYGPVLYNDFYNGETYDARLELDGWCDKNYDTSKAPYSWKPAGVTDAKTLIMGTPTAQEMGNICIMDTLTPISVSKVANDTYIYDFGQNFTGLVEITVKGKAGQLLTLRYGEMLNDDSGTGDGPEGTLYTANLREAEATDRYYMKGSADGETWIPTLTYHGFRYFEIKGLTEPLDVKDVKGLVMYTKMDDAGEFESSEELINQLFSNAYWGQRSNFTSIPTDCPQRNERSGWSGDAQIFAGTAAYNMDVKQFYTHYINTLNDYQLGNGAYTDVAPDMVNPPDGLGGAGGWADAGIIIPYTMYVRYGDDTLLYKYYDNMKKYIDFLLSASGAANGTYIKTRECHYGDWVSIGEDTPKELCDTAFCVYSCDLMVEIAKITGHDEDAAIFADHASKFRAAWCKAFLNDDGSTKCGTQTSYVLGLRFGIIPEDKRDFAAQKLVDNIMGRGCTLTTGFLGVSYLLPVLCETGHEDTAFALLEQERYPSWLYSVLQGATTIWERWDSYTLENGFGNAGMNSFNHYSYGAVMEWVYNTVIGIRPDAENPGFTHFTLYPTAGGKMTWAKGAYEAQSGRIESAWELSEDDFTFTCTIPANTTATLYLPITSDNYNVTEGLDTMVDVAQAEGVTVVGVEDGRLILELVSGSYRFVVEN